MKIILQLCERVKKVNGEREKKKKKEKKKERKKNCWSVLRLTTEVGEWWWQ